MVTWRRRTSILEDEETRTWMSTLVWFLIKSCFLPISIDEEKIIFKVFSWRTFFHNIIYFGYLITAHLIVYFFTTFNSNPEIFFKGGSSAINFSLTLMGWLNMFSVIMPLIICHGLQKLPSTLIMRKDLKVPPKGYRNILGIFLISIVKYNTILQ